jgi:hypothetical protein
MSDRATTSNDAPPTIEVPEEHFDWYISNRAVNAASTT